MYNNRGTKRVRDSSASTRDTFDNTYTYIRDANTTRRSLECDTTISKEDRDKLVIQFPKQFAFSVLLGALRGLSTRHDAGYSPSPSQNLVAKALDAIKSHPMEQMEYIVTHFQCSEDKEKTIDTVVGEALTLIFAFFDNFVASETNGDVSAIEILKKKYPRAILYVDSHDFTPLHGACCALNLEVIQYFVQWHLEQDPSGRGGLYHMNDSGITSIDTMLDTDQNIIPTLKWLNDRNLLTSEDVNEWSLIHRASHSSSTSTIQFLIDLFPSGVLSEDDDGNLPLHLHLGLRYRERGIFSEQDFEILETLILNGIRNGGVDTIGGLFVPDPDCDNQCTLESVLKEIGGDENTAERVWDIIDRCIRQAGGYEKASILHAAIANKKSISNALFRKILERYGTERCYHQGMLPLTYAISIGLGWADGVQEIFEANREAIYEIDASTNLPAFLLHTAAREGTDLSTMYELMRLSFFDL